MIGVRVTIVVFERLVIICSKIGWKFLKDISIIDAIDPMKKE